MRVNTSCYLKYLFQNAVGQSSFLVVNTDELLDFPRPLTSQWVYIGGIGAEERSSLSSVS